MTFSLLAWPNLILAINAYINHHPKRTKEGSAGGLSTLGCVVLQEYLKGHCSPLLFLAWRSLLSLHPICRYLCLGQTRRPRHHEMPTFRANDVRTSPWLTDVTLGSKMAGQTGFVSPSLCSSISYGDLCCSCTFYRLPIYSFVGMLSSWLKAGKQFMHHVVILLALRPKTELIGNR